MLNGYQTVPDAAKRLDKDESWINRMLNQGRIPGARRFGPIWAIPTDAQIQEIPKEYRHSEEERARYREYQRQWRARNRRKTAKRTRKQNEKKQSVPEGFCESCENPLSKYNPDRICEACKRARRHQSPIS